MPFVTDTTEYTQDEERACFEGDLDWALTELLRMDHSERYHQELIRWVLKCEPKLLWFIGTPMNHVRKMQREWQDRHEVWRKTMPIFYPEGRAQCLSPLASKSVDKAMDRLDTGTDLLATIPRHYKTMVGETRVHFANKLFRFINDNPDWKNLLGENSFELLGDFILALKNTWLPKTMDPEQIYAHDYYEECMKLQASSAGRKAKKLLLDNLTDIQAEDYLRKGYFFVRTGKHLYVIERGFPNGNILRVRQVMSKGGQQHLYATTTYCFHAEEPHPLDDIILAQKLIIETDEEEFLAKANASKPPYLHYPLRWSLRGI